MLLSKDYNSQLKKPKPKTLKSIPGLKCDVRIRPLSGLERVEYFATANEKAESYEGEFLTGFVRMVVMVIFTVIDDEGAQVYTMDDFDIVADLEPRSVMAIAVASQKLSGLDIEDLEGNS